MSSAMCSPTIFYCFPPYLPGFIEAGLHCIYTGFFIIEAATYGLHLEQKFHGVLQILLINFYIVLLCILFLRWHVSRRSLGCHLFISLASCTLTVFIGQMILLYLEHMEKSSGTPRVLVSSSDSESTSVVVPLKMDLVILILDIFVYLLITTSYIVLLIRISIQVHRAARQMFSEDLEDAFANSASTQSDYLTRF